MRLGIDLGSTAIKAVLLDNNDMLLDTRIVPTGGLPAQTARAVAESLCPCGLPAHIGATGYGRALVNFATRRVTEITCHAAGVRRTHPDAASLIDIGGQDSKTIRLDERGAVADFAMNDKCAAGTGSFFDALARRFALEREEMARLALTARKPLAVSATCVVFAESEIIGLLAEGAKLAEILAGVYAAVAQRTGRLFAQAGCAGPAYFTGGVANNEALRKALETELQTPVRTAHNAQLMGALGAALLA